MEKIGFLHSYCTAPVGARTSASGAGDLKYATTRGAYWSLSVCPERDFRTALQNCDSVAKRDASLANNFPVARSSTTRFPNFVIWKIRHNILL